MNHIMKTAILVALTIATTGVAWADRPSAEVADQGWTAPVQASDTDAAASEVRQPVVVPLLDLIPLNAALLSSGSTCPDGTLMPMGCLDPASYCECIDGGRISCCVQYHCNPDCQLPLC